MGLAPGRGCEFGRGSASRRQESGQESRAQASDPPRELVYTPALTSSPTLVGNTTIVGGDDLLVLDRRIGMFPSLQALGFQAYGPIPLAALSEIQAHWGLSFPEDYLSFLRETGGGYFDEDVSVRCEAPPPGAPDGLACLDDLFGLDGRGTYTLLDVDKWVAAQLMPARVVPIGDTLMGDGYLLDLRRPSATVGFWDHDEGHIYLVAHSFSEFLERIALFSDS